MSESKRKGEKRVERKPVKVRLNELVLSDLSLGGAPNGAGVDDLTDMFDNTTPQEVKKPIEFYIDSAGRKMVVTGRRRIVAYRHLARQNAPGFSVDREVEAFELVGATAKEIQCRTIADTVVRCRLSDADRARFAKILRDNGIPPELAGL